MPKKPSHKSKPQPSATSKDSPLVERDFVALATLSQRLGMSRSTVKRFLLAGGVKPFYFGSSRNSTVRFLADEVEVLLRSARQPSPLINPAPTTIPEG